MAFSTQLRIPYMAIVTGETPQFRPMYKVGYAVLQQPIARRSRHWTL
jgi:hypothetical protein